MSRGMSERAKMSGEAYLKGRQAGVEGTMGAARKGVAEKTVFPGDDGDSGGEDGLGAAARSLYQNALANGDGRKDAVGDRALHER